VNHIRQRGTATGQAVQLSSAISDEDFAIAGAFAFDRDGFDGDGRSFAVSRGDAHALSVFQESFFASASDDAIASADRTRMGVGAGGRAGGTAFEEDFVFAAFGHGWEHHERFWLRNRGAFTGLDTFSGFRTEVTLFASAAGHADTGAQRIGVFARAVATFALTVFFIVATFWHWWEHHERFGLNAKNANIKIRSLVPTNLAFF